MADAEMVEAIRADALVGRGSCSAVDECYDDKELAEQLAEENIATVEGAIKWARDLEQLHLENGTNCSSGESDCPLVAAYHEFKARRAEVEGR